MPLQPTLDTIPRGILRTIHDDPDHELRVVLPRQPLEALFQKRIGAAQAQHDSRFRQTLVRHVRAVIVAEPPLVHKGAQQLAQGHDDEGNEQDNRQGGHELEPVLIQGVAG